MRPDELPIDAELPRLVQTLRTAQAAVLTAPPGAGKSTRVPLALLRAGLAGDGQVVLLQPRRLAARTVARMMARSLGEPVGETVGYRVRFDDCSSPRTRVLVLTEGILTRRLLADPVLEGVGCVILDEFHERSLHADLALAFVRELLEVRDDLRLLVMSATLQAAPICRFLGDCPHLACEARQHPLSIEHVEADGANLLASARRGEHAVLGRATRQALLRLISADDDDGGDLLVFLPGAPEIRRTVELLANQPLPGRPELVPLHGALSAALQDRALVPAQGRRRVVLATNIAETSLTVPRVTAVVDAGLAKQPRFDAAVGLDRLELTRISRSSATQRAGRAGRLGPGRALRLWSRADHVGLLEADTPEVQRVDLAQAMLAVLSFHPADPACFAFFEAPAPANLQQALALLRLLGAVERDRHRLTPLGQRLARLPVPPRVGAMLEQAKREGLAQEGAMLAAILAERDPLSRDAVAPAVATDLFHRRDLLLELEHAGSRPRAAQRLGLEPRAVRAIHKARDQLLRLAGIDRPHAAADEVQLRRLVLAGYPDRVCRRRGPSSDQGVMVGGRGVRLEEGALRETELFLALWAEAGRRGTHAASLVRLASAVTREDLQATFPDLLATQQRTLYDAERDRVLALRRLLFADLVLQEEPGEVDPTRAAELLAAHAAERFDELFRPDPRARQLVARLRLAAEHLPDLPWPDVSPDGLRRMLPGLCAGCQGRGDVRRLDWAAALESRMGRRQRQVLERQLPGQIRVPSGRKVTLGYAEALETGGTPLLAVKLQELFGLADTPRLLGGRLPVTLHLLAPNGRPVQVTRDLRSFWNETYREVRKDLRGRYPKHPWPEDPWTAPATARTRPRKKGS